MRILVTGAAGYIGSVVSEQLIEQGHDVIALDDLRHGHRAAVHPQARFVQIDLADQELLVNLFDQEPIDAVVHLAAEALIDESIRNPGRFYRANVTGGLNLLEAMAGAGVRKIVFSSTAAVYGEPTAIPIVEDAPKDPVNSYGESKLVFERMMRWYQRAHGLQHISLRYFNACGATADRGEFHVPETHLIPILFEVALGQKDAIQLFGSDYDTPDGTCLRDYVHVVDIARAHALALENLDRMGGQAYNMGNGTGYSNAQVIDCVRAVTGHSIPIIQAPRRPGDPARLVASHDKIRRDLGWKPQYPQLQAMVETAWRWRKDRPQGYAS